MKISIFYEKESAIKKISKIILYKLKFKTQLNSGPNQVALNLIESLKKSKIKFNINPFREKDIAEISVVLSGKKNYNNVFILKIKILLSI